MKLFKKSLLTIGLLLSIVGVFFLISHWPFQKPIFITGFSFLYTYCLIFFFQRIQKHNEKILLAGDISGLIATTLYFIGISVNLLDFQYDIILSWIFLLSLIIFISLLSTIVIKRDENRRFRITWLIISVLLLLLTGYVTIIETSREIRSSYVELHDGLSSTLDKQNLDIDRLLMSLDTTHHNYEKITSIVLKKDSLNDLINNLKVSFLKSTSHGGEAITDTIYIENQSMILALKCGIRDYQDFLISTVDNERLQDKIRDALNTETDNENTSWEENHFKHLPMSGLITILTGLQININSASDDAIYYLKEIDDTK